MDDLETGKDKIKKICEILKNESLEPAKQEGARIISDAQNQAHEILRAAEKKAKERLEAEQKKIEKEKELFQLSLKQACKQTIESLRQEIEATLFNKELTLLVENGTRDGKAMAEMISALVRGIEKEGLSVDFSAVISQTMGAKEVNQMLAKEILEQLREKSVILGDFAGGVQIKLHDKNLVLDLSDSALKELLGKYLRKDFRTLLFAS